MITLVKLLFLNSNKFIIFMICLAMPNLLLAETHTDKKNEPIKLDVLSTYYEPMKGEHNTVLIINPPEFRTDDLISALKKMCYCINNIDRHNFEIYTNRKFYQEKNLIMMRKNAPFLPSSKLKNNKIFKLVRDNFIASYLGNGSLIVFPLKNPPLKIIVDLGKTWCNND